MQYYEVYVATPGYQKPTPLTYDYTEVLQLGTIVAVPFGPRKSIGFIHKRVNKPDFATKPISYTLPLPPLTAAARELHAWLIAYYAASSGATTQLFTPPSLLTKPRKKSMETTATAAPEAAGPHRKAPADLPPLTTAQSAAITAIDTAPKHHALLHGETGSGKTRIYIERTRTALQSGRSAIILTPEISLTPQLVSNFQQVFGDRIILIHSRLTSSARRDIWLRIASAKEPLVIIGARSALFAPVQELGLIVVDEMHEPAYKQDQSPRYHALRVAGKLAAAHKAEAVYGSATPLIADYFLAESTNMPIITMTESAKVATPISFTVVNLADKTFFGRNRQLSDALLRAIEKRLAAREQSLLFLNRRGTARLVLCQDCGWQALCPHCDLPLTFHADFHELRCHTCGHHETPPYSCPECSGTELRYQSIGTKALTEILIQLFPEARIRRFDTDNNAEDSLDKHYESVRKGDIDILVGTQMLGKGLDLPRLSLVGIVQADTSLNIPDFSSAERSYQLLHQAIGRVGRGHLPGEVILQTYNPDSLLLQAAVQRDWHSLYKSELLERKLYRFPPFRFLLKLSVSRKSPESAEKSARKLYAAVQELTREVDMGEPAPAFYEQSHGMYHWQIIIRSTRRTDLLTLLAQLPAGNWTFDIDPLNLL